MHRRPITTIMVLLTFLILGDGVATAAGFSPVSTPATYDWIFTGTRTESMGQADLAAPRGVMTGLYNPAPLHEGKPVQMGFGQMDYWHTLRYRQYGVAVEAGGLRFSAVRMELSSDDLLVRTAYNPEGNGETFRLDDRLQVFSLGVDIAQLAHPHSPWNWTVALSHRNYRSATGDDVQRLDGWDFGSSARYRRVDGRLRLALSASGVLRNIDKIKYSPEDTHFGLAMTAAYDAPESGRELLSCTIAVAVEDGPKDPDFFGTRRVGLEMTMLGALSLRLGHDSHVFGGSSQMGIGLRAPDHWIHPVGLSFDWGSLDSGNFEVFDETSFETFTLTGSLAL